MKSSTDKINVRNTVVPDHLVDLILHWSQWINRKEKRCFLIVDSIDAQSLVNPTDIDFVQLLEQGVRNQDGTRKFIRIRLDDFVNTIISGQLEYFDPVSLIEQNT